MLLSLIIRFCFTLNRYMAYTDPGSSVQNTQCLVNYLEHVADKFRGPVDCSMCVNVTGVKRVKNLSQVSFIQLYKICKYIKI